MRGYLSARLEGRADDTAAVVSFSQRKDEIDRENLFRRFGWDPKKPVVAVYASNYFDFPHKSGMSRFRDFEDWIVTTHAVAKVTPAFNWLFKAHPLDERFGGVTLTDIRTGGRKPASACRRSSDKSAEAPRGAERPPPTL